MSGARIDQAIAIVGREPINPVGQCFESAIRQALWNEYPPGFRVRLCHGIGRATMPGIEGKRIGHAWVEVTTSSSRIALDTTWGTKCQAETYRQGLSLELVLEYSPATARTLWELHDMPGPWDKRIRDITDRVGGAS